ncbi:MAG TPA: 30S ribosomal protein S20 [Bryobacteraceae bacterium]|nr:30S ribosomal protein S20 [Bryobacteraceae bacterium]
MANHVSALKRVRQTERKTAVNRLRKSRMRTQIRKMRRMLAGTDLQAASAELSNTYSIVDRAAKWGIIKKNTAARYKARLTARFSKLSSPKAA